MTIRESIIEEAELLKERHPSKDCRFFANSVYEYFKELDNQRERKIIYEVAIYEHGEHSGTQLFSTKEKADAYVSVFSYDKSQEFHVYARTLDPAWEAPTHIEFVFAVDDLYLYNTREAGPRDCAATIDGDTITIVVPYNKSYSVMETEARAKAKELWIEVER